MKEIEITSLDGFVNELLGALSNTNTFRFDPIGCGKITRRKVVKTVTTTISTLIEDDQLLEDLVKFCKGRYVVMNKPITKITAKHLLEAKLLITDIYKLSISGDYKYEMDYPDIYNYRYEGDYCPDAKPTIHRYSFSDVLDEFIELHPDKCRWEEVVETKVEEE